MQRNRGLEPHVDPMEDEEEVASQFPYHVWGFGVVIPLAIVLLGLYCLGTNTAWFINIRNPRTWWELDGRFFLRRVIFAEYHGRSATSLAITYICMAAYLHSQVFWSTRKRFEKYAEIGKTVAGIGIGVGLVLFIFFMVWDS